MPIRMTQTVLQILTGNMEASIHQTALTTRMVLAVSIDKTVPLIRMARVCESIAPDLIVIRI